MTTTPITGLCCISSEQADDIRRRLPQEQEAQDVASLFRVLGDPNRIRILSALRSEPMCVKDLALVLGMERTAVSHQLTVLRHNRLVRYRKEGKMTVYALDDNHVESLFSVGFDHVREGGVR